MSDGSTKPIADVALGDKVIATDPATGATSDEVVTWLHEDLDVGLTDVEVEQADGTSFTLHTTQNHPFWNPPPDRG